MVISEAKSSVGILSVSNKTSRTRNRARHGDSPSAHRLEPTLAASPPPTVDSRRPLAEGRGPPRAVSLPAPETVPATEALRLLAAAALAACAPRRTHSISMRSATAAIHRVGKGAPMASPNGDHGTHWFHHPKYHHHHHQLLPKQHTSYTQTTQPTPHPAHGVDTNIAAHSSGSHLATNACNHKQSCSDTCTSTHTFTMEAMEGLRPPLDADAWDAPSSPPPSSPLSPSAAPSLPAPSLSFPASSVPALACTCDVQQHQATLSKDTKVKRNPFACAHRPCPSTTRHQWWTPFPLTNPSTIHQPIECSSFTVQAAFGAADWRPQAMP